MIGRYYIVTRVFGFVSLFAGIGIAYLVKTLLESEGRIKGYWVAGFALSIPFLYSFLDLFCDNKDDFK